MRISHTPILRAFRRARRDPQDQVTYPNGWGGRSGRVTR
jgi:hypothetical protein